MKGTKSSISVNGIANAEKSNFVPLGMLLNKYRTMKIVLVNLINEYSFWIFT